MKLPKNLIITKNEQNNACHICYAEDKGIIIFDKKRVKYKFICIHCIILNKEIRKIIDKHKKSFNKS